MWPAGHTCEDSRFLMGSTVHVPVRAAGRPHRIGPGRRCPRPGDTKLAEFVSIYGIWLVAAFIALESIGIPLPAEAALIAAGFFAARTHGFDIWSLIAAGIGAAILGEIVGFWIGRRFGHQLLMRYGARLGFTEGRIKIGQWLFVRYGGRFVFIARFLPVLRNMAAVLAGTNAMAQHNFYFASATAAAAWIICYGLAAYSFGEAFANLASPAALFLGLASALIVLAAPALILRYEKRLLAKAERGLPNPLALSCGVMPPAGTTAAWAYRLTPADSAALWSGRPPTPPTCPTTRPAPSR
jgi:membrane protein DedA with SNARE-associated domain